MSKYPMPCGKPVWRNNLEDVELDTLYGFIEAYVLCPKEINHPFLPYRDKKDNTLLFPTGEFIGVYYSEELKYARNLGYKIIPLRGYMFEKKSSPFESFVSSLYNSRLEAKKEGSEAMSFIYKICMNSLYGRLGMNPESTVTEICNEDRYKELLSMSNFQSAEKLNDDYYIVNIISNSSSVNDKDWNPPRNLAVQMSAAITACARMEMYPFISRPDCYYTDTDSVVLGSPLPEDLISSVELGKFKLEDKLLLGIFLAPKSYTYETKEKNNVIKHKGPAKDLVTSEWFLKQLADVSRTEVLPSSANFRIDWRTLHILKKESSAKLGLPDSRKRKRVFNENDVWIDTEPVEVIDIGKLDPTTRSKLQLMDIKAQMAEKDALRDNQMEDLKAQIVLRDNQIGDLKEKIAQRDNQIEDLQGRIAQRDYQIEDLQGQIAQRDFQIKEIKAEIEDIKAIVADLQAKMAEKDKDKQKEEIEDKISHDASTEGQNTPTVQPTLYNTKAEAKAEVKKAKPKKAKKAKKDHDNRPKPDE